MEDRSSAASKTAGSSSSQTTTPDVKVRPLYSTKLGDPKARAATVETTQTTRQPPVQQKAWTSAKNPITGRTQPSQNNSFSQNKTSSLREGQRVRITLASGAEYEGIFANSPNDPSSCSLRMVQQKKNNSGDIVNGTTRRDQGNMSFQRKDITDARVVAGNNGRADGKTPNGSRGFRTDTAISNSRSGAERELQRWVPDSNMEVDGSLEKSTNNGGHWDQFHANETLFGLKTDYDENIYTTTIDKSAPNYNERVAAADKKAREIERSVPTTAHVAEERVMDFAGGDDAQDEEDKYSGVRRQEFPPLAGRENKYTPPARRAPTGQATVKGAPVDPAIISAQLKGASKQTTPKPEENKTPVSVSVPTGPANDKLTTATSGSKDEAKPAETTKTTESSTTESKPTDAKASDKSSLRPSATANRTVSQTKEGVAPSATSTVERDVLNSFKTFATQQRQNVVQARNHKIKADNQVKLIELKKFAAGFKLSTPVPQDLIGIIAKDPAKQKAIQEKALLNAEEMARQKAAQAKVTKDKEKEKETIAAKEVPAKPVPEQTASTTTTPAESRSNSRPTAPQHSSSPAGLPNRHTGPRPPYNPQQSHYQYSRNNRGGHHMGGQGQPTGNLAQRLRNVEQAKHQPQQHSHMGQHLPVQDMRVPPTGPANVDPSFSRRLSNIPPQNHLQQQKLNPNSHEFRPSAYAPVFNPAGPSQGSSPRSSVNNISEPMPVAPVGGQLIRRKTRAVDVKKCLILSHLEAIQAPHDRKWDDKWDDNDGLKPSYDTPPTWRQLQEDMEKPDSTMHMTYKEFFEKQPYTGAALATPNPQHSQPSMPHQHQLPFHLQPGAPHMQPRQSPHIPPMQMHAAQHVPVPHVPFNNPDDHRMMHSNSAQSYASPRLGHIPMAYPPNVVAPAQMPYNGPVMQPFMPQGTPQMNQYRSFSNNPGFMPQQPPHMGGGPVMVQPQFVAAAPNGMVPAGAQMQVYPAAPHGQFMAPGAGPQAMVGSNGFPSPGRPAAPMMVHQGSHQGQPPVYGMSPGMPYQQPAFSQQPQGKFSGPRPQ